MAVEIFLSPAARLSYALTLSFETTSPLFLAAILADQLKIALIEPADETFEDSNIFLKLVQRRHLQFQIHSGK
jgi:hypothetical protein